MATELQHGGSWEADSAALRKTISNLAQESTDVDHTYSGLIDLDLTFDLIESRLNLALLLISHPDRSNESEKTAIARDAAVASVLDMDRLAGSTLSMDQRGIIGDDPRMGRVRELMTQVVASGGGPLFTAEPDPKKARRVVRVLTAALMKHAGRPAAGRPTTGRPTAGRGSEDVEPGAEGLIFSDSMTLPVSQAALMVREEFIPALNEQLLKEPGNADLQRRLVQLEEQATIFETAQFFPRARPVEIEPGLLTDTMVGFTPSGEAVVHMRIPVISTTGNRLDRIREQVQAKVVRDLAGRGFSSKLDEKAHNAGDLRSGLTGAADDRLASVRVDEAFKEVSSSFPFLGRLLDPEALGRLVQLAEEGRSGEIRAYLQSAAATDNSLLTGRVRKLLDTGT